MITKTMLIKIVADLSKVLSKILTKKYKDMNGITIQMQLYAFSQQCDFFFFF